MKKIKIILLFVLVLIGTIGLLVSKSKNQNETGAVYDNEQKTQIVLYYTNTSDGTITPEYRFVNLKDIKEDMIGTVLKELIKGPTNADLESKVPEDTTVNSISKEEGKIVVDFSKKFAEKNEDELDRLGKIYSVVNTLTEIKEINEVEIKVDGKEYETRKRL